MTRTLVQIRKQINKLQKEAEKVKTNEVAGVIRRIKVAIDFYSLTASDLFGTNGKTASKGKQAKSTSKKEAKKSPSPAKYRDKDSGKTWTGHGKRPGWFVQAIANGVKADDLKA